MKILVINSDRMNDIMTKLLFKYNGDKVNSKLQRWDKYLYNVKTLCINQATPYLHTHKRKHDKLYIYNSWCCSSHSTNKQCVRGDP